MEQNICLFTPFRRNDHSIHTINFVLETTVQKYNGLKSDSVYKIYYVLSGTGKLHGTGKISFLEPDDIFFTFPGSPFAIESVEDFSYMYISFVGLRGNMILESLKISSGNFLFHGDKDVCNFWQRALTANPKVIDWMCESVLMYTFSFLGNLVFWEDTEPRQMQISDLVRKYMDDHFAEHNLSLAEISSQLSYNPKYISHVFKKHMGIGIVEYLHTIQIQNACTMIEQGFTSINDIADKCGYSDARYFSKVFKQKMGISPTQHIKRQKNRPPNR